ncbi:aldehyde dehydrogenase [Trichodelitschia bisporula]|uniref:aldehyde dehydrogenase (NAD(+)) n=1 Tax=Trichodelitschia bisporula TaxID=703511 RepID=A0A6G1HSR9_9PEZI|nr:aldehyde dehydrogenase [Trichodelitschia bisporula]
MAPVPVPEYIETRLFINGEFVNSSTGKTFDVFSPYDQHKVATVQEATEPDIDAAVSAAKAAFPAWSALAPTARGTLLRKLGDAVAAATSDLAALDALVMGRPISTYFDGPFAAELLHHYSEAGFEPAGKTSLHTPGTVNLTLRQPVGVAAAIIPWNVPMIILAHKVGPALAAGCTLVVKSSEKAPLSSLRFAQLVREVGFPSGVVNVVSGFGRPAGEALARHMDVRMISFTGSGPTGKLVQKYAAESNLKRVVLELGGKSPTLVFEDADVEAAAAEAAFGIRFVSGQACVAGSRVYVQESAAERFKRAFEVAFAEFVPGDPLDPATTMGPQADRIQFERVKGFLEEIRNGDGQVRVGGGALEVNGKGFFIQPTVFEAKDEGVRAMREEIFGPVISINTFTTEEEAIAKAVDTEYGLFSSVYTKNIDRALRVAKAMEAGVVAVNCTAPAGLASDMPFGGYKQSGLGREGFGYSIENYLQTKTVTIKLAPA